MKFPRCVEEWVCRWRAGLVRARVEYGIKMCVCARWRPFLAIFCPLLQVQGQRGKLLLFLFHYLLQNFCSLLQLFLNTKLTLTKLIMQQSSSLPGEIIYFTHKIRLIITVQDTSQNEMSQPTQQVPSSAFDCLSWLGITQQHIV